MKSKYLKINLMFQKWIWLLVILGLLSSIPIIYNRYLTEQSSNFFEITFDYSDLVELASYESNANSFINDQLKVIKNHGISSMTVFESSLDEMRKNQYIKVLNSDEINKYETSSLKFNENFTYIIFQNQLISQELKPIIIEGFRKAGTRISEWSNNEITGLKIELSKETANLVPLEPNPIVLKLLKNYGFDIIIRLSNRTKFDAVAMEKLLSKFQKLQVKRIIIDGEEAPGYSIENETRNLEIMAELLNKYEIGLSTIELSKNQQKGLDYLARETNYNIVRLHSLIDNESSKIAEQILSNQSKLASKTLSDRFVLAVKDRNIRIVLLNVRPILMADRKIYINPLPVILDSLTGENGAINRIQNLGYKIGKAESFHLETAIPFRNVLNLFIYLGSLSLIVILINYFFRQSMLLFYILGLTCMSFIFIFANQYFLEIFTLVLAVSIPSLAMIRLISHLNINKSFSDTAMFFIPFNQLLITSAISLIGVILLISLLDHSSYLYVLEQFRGVTILHVLPIIIVILYVAYLKYSWNIQNILPTTKSIFNSQVNLFSLLLIMSSIVVIGYYLSRTGNNGQVLNFEYMFRTFLENNLGARPRTKEFLLSHPFLILSIYLWLKYKNFIYLVAIGIIGQISIVDTFLHIHTPLLISITRVFHGLWIGIVLGALLIFTWELVSRRWNSWTK